MIWFFVILMFAVVSIMTAATKRPGAELFLFWLGWLGFFGFACLRAVIRWTGRQFRGEHPK